MKKIQQLCNKLAGMTPGDAAIAVIATKLPKLLADAAKMHILNYKAVKENTDSRGVVAATTLETRDKTCAITVSTRVTKVLPPSILKEDQQLKVLKEQIVKLNAQIKKREAELLEQHAEEKYALVPKSAKQELFK